MVAHMSKRVALPGAIKAIREARAGAYDPSTKTYAIDPRFGVGQFSTTVLISAAHLVNIEKSRKSVTPEVLERIADALGVSLDAISYIAAEEAAS